MGRYSTTLNVSVSDIGGTPASVTVIVKTLVLGACANVGVHVNNPLEVKLALGGAPGPRTKVRFVDGESRSLADTVKLSVCPTTRVWSFGFVRTGAAFGPMLFVPGVAAVKVKTSPLLSG